MPPYLFIQAGWKAEGKKIEEKSGNDSRNGNKNRKHHHRSVIPSGVPSSVLWMTERSRGTLCLCRVRCSFPVLAKGWRRDGADEQLDIPGMDLIGPLDLSTLT
jgi:hypothetical protein